jgi:hypothetical protein
MKRKSNHIKINIVKNLFNNSIRIFNRLFKLSHNKKNTKRNTYIKLSKIYPT